MKNPKFERRRPKEVRTPNPESPRVQGFMDNTSDFWNWGDEPGGGPMVLREDHPPNRPLEDLGERTSRFGEAIIEFAKKIPQTPVTNRLISQLVGAATSVAANYCEADDAVSGREFKQKIGYSRKESKETMLLLRLVAKAEPTRVSEARILWREAKELNLIFGAIWRK